MAHFLRSNGVKSSKNSSITCAIANTSLVFCWFVQSSCMGNTFNFSPIKGIVSCHLRKDNTITRRPCHKEGSCKLNQSSSVLFLYLGWYGIRYFVLSWSTLMCGTLHQQFLILIINIFTFIDDYSRCTLVYFLHTKSEVFDAFKTFLKLIDNQFSKSIKILRSGSERRVGGIYCSSFP